MSQIDWDRYLEVQIALAPTEAQERLRREAAEYIADGYPASSLTVARRIDGSSLIVSHCFFERIKKYD